MQAEKQLVQRVRMSLIYQDGRMGGVGNSGQPVCRFLGVFKNNSHLMETGAIRTLAPCTGT